MFADGKKLLQEQDSVSRLRQWTYLAKVLNRKNGCRTSYGPKQLYILNGVNFQFTVPTKKMTFFQIQNMAKKHEMFLI